MNRNEVTLDNIREGLESFNRQHGYYPSAEEIDNCPYLPSSRQIQRKFGGLKRIREAFGLIEIDYRTGIRRQAEIGRFLGEAIDAEKETRKFLDKRYGEICVHEEKKYGDGRNRVDFFVYAKNNFAVEVFHTTTLRSLSNNLNIKLHKFKDFPFKLYFVVSCDDFSQGDIDGLVARKNILRISPNMRVMMLDAFKRECIANLPPLLLRTSYHKSYPYKKSLFD